MCICKYHFIIEYINFFTFVIVSDTGFNNDVKKLLLSKKDPCEIIAMIKGAEYKLANKTGPKHALTYTIAVHALGRTGHGTGTSKKQAKENAAERLVSGLRKIATCSDKEVTNYKSTNASLTKKAVDIECISVSSEKTRNSPMVPNTFNRNGNYSKYSRSAEDLNVCTSVDDIKKPDPVKRLLESFRSVSFDRVTREDKCLSYVVTVTIGNDKFIGSGKWIFL